mmetsp:Transcript_67232/g.216926  ORF Transcript_67232/g.216926 Transcript_67232/m.216926 type:complete len:245 (-) Transcript_67232:212-946(-)
MAGLRSEACLPLRAATARAAGSPLQLSAPSRTRPHRWVFCPPAPQAPGRRAGPVAGTQARCEWPQGQGRSPPARRAHSGTWARSPSRPATTEPLAHGSPAGRCGQPPREGNSSQRSEGGSGAATAQGCPEKPLTPWAGNAGACPESCWRRRRRRRASSRGAQAAGCPAAPRSLGSSPLPLLGRMPRGLQQHAAPPSRQRTEPCLFPLPEAGSSQTEQLQLQQCWIPRPRCPQPYSWPRYGPATP